MNYNDMKQIAQNYVAQRSQNNMPVRYDDTVCVLHTCRNNIFTGFSGLELDSRGTPVSKHAEKDVINNLLMYNDLVIDCFAVFNASTLSFVPPCSNCIHSLLRLHPANANSAILTPSKVVWLGQAEQFFYHHQTPPDTISNSKNHSYYQNSENIENFKKQQQRISAEMYNADEKDYDGTYLKNKLNMLFDDGDNDIQQYEENTKKKKRFGLFGKK